MTEQQKNEITQRLSNGKQWLRIVFMALFWLVLYVSMVVIGVIILIQILFNLFSGSKNNNLSDFSRALTTYINQILLFLSYEDERKPFPFAAWGDVEELKQENVIEDNVDGSDS